MMDQQGAKRIKHLLAKGQNLITGSDAVDTHRDFEEWVEDVGSWLERWGSLASVAKWVALPTSPLIIGNEYHNYPDAWIRHRQACSARLAWLSDELRIIEKPVVSSKIINNASKRNDRVFIVHGHDEALRETVARYIQKLGFLPIILHEQPNKGRTIINKFREEAVDIGFAVVLMTPDDEGAKVGGQMKFRARQNVVFELGFFIGAIGPEKVAALIKGNVERPSDFDGVVYISVDESNWKIDLAQELKAAGLEIDFNKVMTA